MTNAIRILGLDPGLRLTGWGIITIDGARLSHVAHGVIKPDNTAPFATRLLTLFDGIMDVIAQYAPQEAAVEETFLNSNAASTLKLGQARAAAVAAEGAAAPVAPAAPAAPAAPPAPPSEPAASPAAIPASATTRSAAPSATTRSAASKKTA